MVKSGPIPIKGHKTKAAAKKHQSKLGKKRVTILTVKKGPFKGFWTARK